MVRGLASKVLKNAGRVNRNLNPVAGVAGVPGISFLDPLTLASKKKYGAAAGNLIGGQLGEVATRATGRGYRTAQRFTKRQSSTRSGPRLLSPRVKRAGIGFVRGATTSLVKNRRVLGNALTSGALSVGEVANKAVKKSPLATTRVGKALTKDISAPLYKKLKLRKRLKSATGGVFSRVRTGLYHF